MYMKPLLHGLLQVTDCMCSSTLVYVYEASSAWPFTGDCMYSSTLVYVYEASSAWPFTGDCMCS